MTQVQHRRIDFIRTVLQLFFSSAGNCIYYITFVAEVGWEIATTGGVAKEVE